MINPFREVNWHPNVAERRQFAISLLVGFPILGVVLFVVRGAVSHHWNYWPSFWMIVVGGGIGGLCWVLPVLALPFYLGWYFVACCIGLVVTNSILAGFYLAVFAPTGFVLRRTHRLQIRKTFDSEAQTYWQDTEQVSDPSRYYKQY